MESAQQNYVVLIGDISGSRQLTGRNRYQSQLYVKSAIVQINEQFRGQLEAPLTISKGDEFQGLLTQLQPALEIMLYMEKLTFPVPLRFGIGVGPVYKMGGSLPIEMDGPAFHRANAALNLAKKKKVAYRIETPWPEEDQILNVVFRLMSAIKSRWNERHFRLFWAYKEFGTYREVAQLEGITPQAVCDALKNCRALDVRAAEEDLLAYLSNRFTHLLQSSSELSETAASR
ncbi:MAG: hypothetical protein D6715_04025 [Calditrichaeota bacterium]|nr:MAG: hypothetical protein D6715_04025 [Calditrichota bacterium]